MNEQQVGEIAEAAFETRFGDIKVFRVNVWRRLDHEGAPVVDVNIIYDGKYEQLNGGGLLKVRRETSSKVWRDAEDSPGFPLVHFIPKSEIGRRDPAMVYSGTAPPNRRSRTRRGR